MKEKHVCDKIIITPKATIFVSHEIRIVSCVPKYINSYVGTFIVKHEDVEITTIIPNGIKEFCAQFDEEHQHLLLNEFDPTKE